MSAKERGRGTGKFAEKSLTLDKNLLLTKYFPNMFYHQTSTNQTKINELKITLCYKCELMRLSTGIVNLANLRTIFGYLFEEIEFTANTKSLPAKERGGGTGRFVEKSLTLGKNLLSAKYFPKMLYHQTTTNQTKINELKIILCYKCELMRPSKGIINLANLRTIFGYLFDKVQ